MAKRKKVAKAHYVDNALFLEAMIEYKKQWQISKDNDEELPIISEYLGSVFLKIAQRLSFRPNFINYAFKNDMISDGIENCLHYIHNFNPEKSSNPFAYFTQIIYYAFIRRIQKEKKQLYIKYKSMQNYEISPEYVEYMNYDEDFKTTTDFKNSDFRVVVDEFVDNFEKSKKKKDAKKRKFTLSRKAQRTQRHLLRWGFSSIDSTRKPGPLGRLGTRCFSLARDFNGRTTCSVFECRFSNSGFFSNSIFMLCGVSIFFLGSPQSKLLQSDSVLRRPRNRHRFD